MKSTSGLSIWPRNCRAYADSDSTYRRWPSAKIVSKARLDLPEPESPVKTMRESRGRSSEMSLRLCSRAPRTMSFSCTCQSSIPCSVTVSVNVSVNVSRSNKRSQDYRSQASRRAAGPALFAPSHEPPTAGLTERYGAPMSDARLVELLDTGTRRLIRSVDKMADDEWSQPSLLPGWSRAHVVAHLTLNAEGLSGALEGVHERRPVPMYRSQEARDGDIIALAKEPPSEL